MHSVFLIVDAQFDFTYGALRNEDAIKALPTIKEIVNYAEEREQKLVYTMDTHSADYLETQEGKNLPISHCISGTKGWLLCPEARPGSEAAFVYKPTFGSLDLYSEMGVNVDKIVMCGFCTDICVSANFQIVKALYPEAEVYVISDACAGVTPDTHEAALKVINSCQGKVRTWEEYKKEFPDE